MDDTPRLYTSREAARRAGVSHRTLQRHIAAGEIQTIRVGKRHLFTDTLIATIKKRPPHRPKMSL